MDILFYVISFIFLLALIFRGKAEFSTIIFVGLVLRLAILFVDLNHIFPILHSGADTEAFHRIAMYNQYGLKELKLTNYTVFLTWLYSIFLNSSPRMVAQFINVIFGVGVILIIRRCLTMFQITYKIKKRIMMLVSFMPNMIIFSAILLREAWVEFFCVLSVFFFLRWFFSRGNALLNMLLSIVCVFIAAYMHAGVIGLGLGYLITYTMYSPKAMKVKITFYTFLSIAMAIGVVAFFLANINMVGGKFAGVEMSDEYIAEELTTAGSKGGSNYMSWLNTSSPIVGLVTLPLRMIFFLFSPIPPYMRGLGDLFAFVCDGFIYMYLMWHIIRAKPQNRAMKRLRDFLLVSVLVTTAIFSLGTNTAGTAIRHRAKYLSVILVAYGATRSMQDKYGKTQIKKIWQK